MKNRDDYLRRKLETENQDDFVTALLFEILTTRDGSEDAIKHLSETVRKKPDFDDRRLIRTILTASSGTRDGLKTLAKKLSDELKKTRQEARDGQEIGTGTIRAIERLHDSISEAVERIQPIEVQIPEIKVPEIKVPEIRIPDITPKTLKLPKKIEVSIPEMPAWYREPSVPDLPITKEGRLRVEVDRVGGGGGSNVPTIGGRVPTKSQDPFEGYYPSDMDTGGETEYYGFVNTDGAWYIQQMTATTSRYVSGSDGYEVAWTSREGLSYDLFYNL